MSMTRKLKACLVALAACAAIVATPGAAAAGHGASIEWRIGKAWFNDNPGGAWAPGREILAATDYQPNDGYRVSARLWRGGEVRHMVTVSSGTKAQGMSLPEGQAYYLQLCKLNWLHMPLDCSKKVRVVS